MRTVKEQAACFALKIYFAFGDEGEPHGVFSLAQWQYFLQDGFLVLHEIEWFENDSRYERKQVLQGGKLKIYPAHMVISMEVREV